MKCDFCKDSIKDGFGLLVVQTDGSVKHFCGSKCERNMKMRNPRKTRWTGIYKNLKATRLELEKKK
ncbi:MAG: 50S ribosomal protein L24 [Candidatus Aenigmarchaeota archaeon]|nr:50S ribosomal protein L24 [Candidatus Aenigmarchaeota archaeon]